jgi:probable F420-dependent oxidoreductase
MSQSTAESGIRSALWLPIFDELADPVVVARLAADAESMGWDGVFVWDHLRWREPVVDVADPWITMAAIASATERIRIGPMITSLPRRRPAKVAKETATLDRLSGGRLTLGVGIGGDRFGQELSKTGEQIDDRLRGEMLDESLSILSAAWSGEPVTHHGEHFTIDAMPFRPRPVQVPGIPIWVAAFPTSRKPRRRAARFQGIFPVNLTEPDQLAEIVADVRSMRAEAGRPADESYDVAVEIPADSDFAAWRAAGATWWMAGFDPEALRLDEVRGVLTDGPIR